MKKIMKAVLIILVFAIVIFLFIYFLKKEKDSFQDVNHRISDESVDVFSNSHDYVYVYLYSNNLKRNIGYSFQKKESNEKNIETILEYYENGYHEAGFNFSQNTKITYTIVSGRFLINFENWELNEDFPVIYFLESLYLNFRPLGIERVYLSIDKTEVKKMGEYTINQGVGVEYITNLQYKAYHYNSLQLLRIFTYKEDYFTYENILIDDTSHSLGILCEELKSKWNEFSFDVLIDEEKKKITISFPENTEKEWMERVKISFEKSLFYSFSDFIVS